MAPRADREVTISARAAAEIRDAAAWYEAQRTGLSVEFVHALDRTFSEIGERPESCPMVRGRIRRALVHRFPYGVFFLEWERAVTVLAVIHARRDPRLWPSRPAR